MIYDYMSFVLNSRNKLRFKVEVKRKKDPVVILNNYYYTIYNEKSHLLERERDRV
jgi:hypothetical protein